MKHEKCTMLPLVAAWLIVAGVGCAQSPPRLRPPRGLPDQPASRGMTVGFAGCPLAKTPADFQTDQTGIGQAASWVVVSDSTAPRPGRVLAQTSADAVNKQRFPICVYQPLTLQDLEVSVRFRPISGQVDQSGGVIVRYQDKDNYYVLRANVLEDNVRFYKLEKGKRSLIAGISAKISAGQWHTLTLLAKGTAFIAAFDDQQFEAGDATFPGPGKIGLWTKADAVTHFDRLAIKGYDTPLPPKASAPGLP